MKRSPKTIVILAIDGTIGQMMEPVEMPELQDAQGRAARESQSQAYQLTGADHRERRVITSLFLKPEELERMNTALRSKDRAVRAKEVRWVEQFTDDAELVVVAFGSAARAGWCRYRMKFSQRSRKPCRPLLTHPFPKRRR